jgi:hypothetical protein
LCLYLVYLHLLLYRKQKGMLMSSKLTITVTSHAHINRNKNCNILPVCETQIVTKRATRKCNQDHQQSTLNSTSSQYQTRNKRLLGFSVFRNWGPTLITYVILRSALDTTAHHVTTLLDARWASC